MRHCIGEEKNWHLSRLNSPALLTALFLSNGTSTHKINLPRPAFLTPPKCQTVTFNPHHEALTPDTLFSDLATALQFHRDIGLGDITVPLDDT